MIEQDIEFNCWGHDFLYMFLSQFLDIGRSAGSLFFEAINIFRLFQRLSASKSFSAKLSNSCLKYFYWARDIFQSIVGSLFRMKPFSDFELFSIYNYVFPLAILTYVSLAGHDIIIRYYNYFIFYFLVTSFGSGFGLIGINILYSILLTVISAILLIIFSVSIYIRVKKIQTRSKIEEDKKDDVDFLNSYYSRHDNDSKIIRETEEIEISHTKSNDCFEKYTLEDYINTRAAILACIVFTALIIPYSIDRPTLQYMIGVSEGILIIFIFISECIYNNNLKLDSERLQIKLTIFISNCYSLLIIPNTESFVQIMKGEYKNKWNCMVGYIFNCIINSLGLTFFMLFVNHSDLIQKYKLSKNEIEDPDESIGLNYYSLFEVVDILRQLSYAICSAYDITWGCIGIEIAWFVLIIVLRPYITVSDYMLSFGTALILIISNGAILYSEYNDTKVFSFALTVSFVIGACIPPVLSILLFFIFDFDKKEIEISDNVPNNDIFIQQADVESLSNFAGIFIASSWLVYGFYIPLLFLNNSK